MKNNPTIPELKQLFEEIEIPRTAVLGGFKITNVKNFIDSHFGYLYGQRYNSKSGRYTSYYKRLVELYDELKK